MELIVKMGCLTFYKVEKRNSGNQAAFPDLENAAVSSSWIADQRSEIKSAQTFSIQGTGGPPTLPLSPAGPW